MSRRGPKELPSWTHEVGREAYVRTSEDHAQCLHEALLDLVRRIGDPKSPYVRELLRDFLEKAHVAGVREGRESAADHLSEAVRGHVERALRSVSIEGGRCPHCLGSGCDTCGGVGRYAASGAPPWL